MSHLISICPEALSECVLNEFMMNLDPKLLFTTVQKNACHKSAQLYFLNEWTAFKILDLRDFLKTQYSINTTTTTTGGGGGTLYILPKLWSKTLQTQLKLSVRPCPILLTSFFLERYIPLSWFGVWHSQASAIYVTVFVATARGNSIRSNVAAGESRMPWTA